LTELYLRYLSYKLKEDDYCFWFDIFQDDENLEIINKLQKRRKVLYYFNAMSSFSRPNLGNLWKDIMKVKAFERTDV